MAEIKIEGVEKQFKSIPAVKNLSLKIREGEFFTFVGPSGCGKSTLLHMIAGLEKVDQGRIYFDDVLVNDLSPKERDVAMVFQSYALYPHLSVFENIAFPLRMRKSGRSLIEREVKRVAESLGLGDLLHRKPKELSGGQRQRVALGRAIIRKPRVFLMDEPLSNLDARLRIEMRAELKKLHRELRITTIYVTHDQAEALSLSDRVAVLNRGRVEHSGTPREVYDKPANLFVAGFIGSPPINLIQAEVVQQNPLQINCNGWLIQPEWEGERSGGPIIVGIRPEAIWVSEPGVPGHQEGMVDFMESAGSFYWMNFNWKGVNLRGICRDKNPPNIGEKIFFDLPLDALLFFDGESGQKI